MGAKAQGIQDSVFTIPIVDINAKYIFKKEDAGMTKTLVDSMVLVQKISQSLSSLLSENTPVFIKSKGRGALATASFRGTAPSHTQVQWNGLNINSPMTGMVDFSLIPIYFIDDLSLEHGGASIASQSGGLGGVINLGNQVRWDDPFEFKYIQTIGSYHTYNEFLSLGFGNKKFQSKTRVYLNQSRNDFTFINRHNFDKIDPVTGNFIHPKDTNKLADYTKYGLLQELYWKPNNSNVFSVRYWGQFADRSLPRVISYEGPVDSNINNQVDVDHRGIVDWKHYGKKSKLVVKAGGAKKSLDYTLKNQVGGDGAKCAIDSKSTSYQLQNSVDYNYDFTETLSLNSSASWSKSWVDTHESVKKTGYNKDRESVSLFASLSKGLWDRVNVTAQARQEWQDYDALDAIWFSGFDFRVFQDYNLILKGNVSRNYHAPTLNDLYWQPGGNPNLKPEDGYTYEVGLEDYWSNTKTTFKWDVTAYYSDIDNWIIWIPSVKGFWEPRNVKNVISKGVEVNTTLTGQMNYFRYKLKATYAYTSSVNYEKSDVWGDESYGKQLVYIPLHSANFLAKVDFKNFFVSYQYNFFSERFTTTSNNVSIRRWLYPYHMNDLSLGVNLYKKRDRYVQLKCEVFNLFNEVYHSVLYSPMPKRNYEVTLLLKL